MRTLGQTRLRTWALALFIPLAAQACARTPAPDNAAIERQNAAEQAAALNQDPGGADRDRLLRERAREPIYAGRPDVRTAHPDAQWFGQRPIGLFLGWGISSVHGGVDISWAMIKNMGAGTKVTPREFRIWNAPFWGYSKKNETSCTPTADLLASLAKSRAWGGALMANWGPRPDGTLPDTYYRSMREFGEWMKANGASIVGTKPAPAGVQTTVPITTKDDVWYLHLIDASGGKASVTTGPSVEGVTSATMLATGEAVPFEWRSGVLHVNRPAPTPDQPHAVIALRVKRAR